MKTIRWVAVLACVALPAAAAGEADFVKELGGVRTAFRAGQAAAATAVLSDVTTEVKTPLNGQTVKCSQADYAMPMLKVLIPALADLTVLNHRNTNEGAPCVAAGRCRVGAEPRELLSRGGEGEEAIKVRVVLKKEMALDGEVCRVTLVESVTTVIRGTPFFHERRHDVAERVPADCR